MSLLLPSAKADFLKKGKRKIIYFIQLFIILKFQIMLYTHTIGRIGKDCQVITGTHGTFMAVDIAVDDYSKGQNITTLVRVLSSRENHVRLAE